MKIKYIIYSIIIILLSSFFIYYYVVPRIVAKAIVSGEYSTFMPRSYQHKLQTTNDNINRFLNKSHQNGVSMDDLLSAIDEVEEQDVRDALNELKATKLHSVGQVYNIAYKHIEIESFDPVLLKPTFLKHVKMHHIEKILKYIERNNLESNLTAKSAKRIAKQIILQKKDKILKKSIIVE